MLEAKLSKVLATIEDEPEPTLLWAMNSLVKLQALNCNILSRLLESRARYQTLVDSLLSACTSTPSSFQTELGYASYVTLGALTMAEVAHFSNADDKVIFLFKTLHKMFKFLNQCSARLRFWKSVSSKTAVAPSSRFRESETLFQN